MSSSRAERDPSMPQVLLRPRTPSPVRGMGVVGRDHTKVDFCCLSLADKSTFFRENRGQGRGGEKYCRRWETLQHQVQAADNEENEWMRPET